MTSGLALRRARQHFTPTRHKRRAHGYRDPMKALVKITRRHFVRPLVEIAYAPLPRVSALMRSLR